MMLALRSAMGIFNRHKNYATAAVFANKLVALGPAANIVQQVRRSFSYAIDRLGS
jgi:hypothetical protein